MNQIFLEGQGVATAAQLDKGAYRVVAHRDYLRADAQPRRDLGRHAAQPDSRAQPLSPIDMRGEVAIAERKPRRPVETLERGERVEALVAESPAVFGIREARQGVDDRIDIGRDVQSVELFVVAGVDDYPHAPLVDTADQSAQEPSRTHSPRKHGDRRLR